MLSHPREFLFGILVVYEIPNFFHTGRQTTNPFFPTNPFVNPFLTQAVAYEYATCTLESRGSGFPVTGIVRFRQQIPVNRAVVSYTRVWYWKGLFTWELVPKAENGKEDGQVSPA